MSTNPIAIPLSPSDVALCIAGLQYAAEILLEGNAASLRLGRGKLDEVVKAADDMKELRERMIKFVDTQLICTSCGKNKVDPPSNLCPGCEAYQEHQR